MTIYKKILSARMIIGIPLFLPQELNNIPCSEPVKKFVLCRTLAGESNTNNLNFELSNV
jgi:hypothetical protein